MMRHRLSALLFLALAGILAWSGNVDPTKAALRWIVVALLAASGIYSLLRRVDRIEHVYIQLMTAGVAIAAVGWLIPGSGSRGLIGIGALLVVLACAQLIRAFINRRRAEPDDTHRPG